MPSLDPVVCDRAQGAILGMAVGDALGAPYEFGPPPGIILTGGEEDMTGGGSFGWEPGEWTDDTSMAIPILEALVANLYDNERDRTLVHAWRRWALEAPDVGTQTRAVLRQLDSKSSADDARAAARVVHESTGRSAGNGSLMRTAPVGIAPRLDRDGQLVLPGAVEGVALRARQISELTHYEDDAGDACVLWSVMIHQAVEYGRLDVAKALAQLPVERRGRWEGLIEEATFSRPEDYPNNGWVVHALQAAWAAIHRAGFDVEQPVAGASPHAFRVAIQHAINAGGDTDTVAAITGGLAGALVGAQGIPLGWKRLLHGWGGRTIDGRVVVRTAGDLAAMAVAARENYSLANWSRPAGR